jgi:hypothetical protein
MAPNHSNKSGSTASRLSFATKSFIDDVQQRCGKLKEFTSGFLDKADTFLNQQTEPKAAKIWRMSFTLVAPS